MSVSSFFNFFQDYSKGSQEEGVEREFLKEKPDEIAKKMIQKAPQMPHVEFIKNVYPIAASGESGEKPLPEHQKRTYDATLSVLCDYRKKVKEEEALNKIPKIISKLNESPNIIKEMILEWFPDNGEYSGVSVFLKTMETKLYRMPIEERSNYYQALHQILGEHLENNISLEILQEYRHSHAFLNEEDAFHLINKAIQGDLQAVFSVLLAHISNPEAVRAIWESVAQSVFLIHPEDVEILLNQMQKSNRQHFINEFCETLPDRFNIHLLVQLVTLSERASEHLQSITQKLCERGDFKVAQDLVDLVGNEIKKERTKKGMLSEAREQLSYVAGYLKYSIFSYSKIEFPGCSEAEMRKVITPEFFADIKKSLDKNTLESFARLKMSMSSTTMPLEKMQQKGLPFDIKQDSLFDAFIQESGVFQAVNYYNHGWVRGGFNNELSILVNSRYMSASEVLEKFELKEIKVGPRIINAIFDKESGKRYCYLEKGLTLHDPTTQFLPIKKVEGDGTYSISFVTTDHGDTTSAPGIQRLLGSHAWIRMQDLEGNVYSAGKWGDGCISSPDYREYESSHNLVSKVTLTAEEFTKIKQWIVGEQQLIHENHFSILEHNCAGFSAAIAKMIFPEISSETTLDMLDSEVNHLKYYYGAVEIAKACFLNKEKLKETLEKIETAQSVFKILEPKFAAGIVSKVSKIQRKSPSKTKQKKMNSSKQSNTEDRIEFLNKKVKTYRELSDVMELEEEVTHIVQKAPQIAPDVLEATARSLGVAIPTQQILDFVPETTEELKSVVEKGLDIKELVSRIEPTRMAVDHFVDLAGVDRDDLEIKSYQAMNAIQRAAFQDFKTVLHALPDSKERNMLLLTLQLLEENLDPKLIPVINDKIKAILKSISVYLDTNNESALTDSIFNLCLSLAKIVSPFIISHPYTLFENLSKMKRVQSLKEKPKS